MHAQSSVDECCFPSSCRRTPACTLCKAFCTHGSACLGNWCPLPSCCIHDACMVSPVIGLSHSHKMLCCDACCSITCLLSQPSTHTPHAPPSCVLEVSIAALNFTAPPQPPDPASTSSIFLRFRAIGLEPGVDHVSAHTKVHVPASAVIPCAPRLQLQGCVLAPSFNSSSCHLLCLPSTLHPTSLVDPWPHPPALCCHPARSQPQMIVNSAPAASSTCMWHAQSSSCELALRHSN